MRNFFLSLLLFTFLLCPSESYAEFKIYAGEYITEGGWGNLNIKQDKKGGLFFEINTVGGNGHTCTLSGAIIGQKSVLDEEGENDKQCVVTFTPTNEGINVTDNDVACRGYCGARAHFASLYLALKPICRPSAIQKTRSEFKKLYDQKDYAPARAKLEPLVSNCYNTLYWWELGWIRNDLAITMYRLGDYSGCRSVLQPLEKDAAETDEDLRAKYGPMVADTALRLVKATRTNLKLCNRVP